jgi:hypothetical protein
MSRVYLVEITAKVDAAGTTEVLRYSDKGYTTTPAETPADTHYEARLKQPALVRRDMFRPGTTYGESQVGIGELVLANQDGELDVLADYGFDGQQLRLLVGEETDPYSAFAEALVGTMDSVEVTQRDLTIRVRDRQAELREPIQTLRYAGTGGLEGNGLDIKGRAKPLVYGKVFNVIPVTVNPALFIYQVASNTIADIPKVYDQGIELTKGTDYPDEATLLSTAPSAGEYRCFGGYFRLGVRPLGLLTCDVVESATAADNTAGQILKRMALQLGVDAGDIDDDSIDDLDLANDAECELFIDSDRPGTECMDEIAGSVGAYYGFDRFGIFRVGRLAEPGTPVVTLDEINILEIEKVTSRDTEQGIPVYRVNLDYLRNYTLQDQSTLAASVAESRLAELQLEYRKVTAEDLAVLNKHKLAPELNRITHLIDATAAQDEADRLLDLYSVRREVFDARVRLDDGLINLLDIGVTVEVDYYRFGLNPKNLIVIGLELDAQVNRASLTLWG